MTNRSRQMARRVSAVRRAVYALLPVIAAFGCSAAGRPKALSSSTESAGLKSMCGHNDLQNVNSYNGQLGPSRAFVRQHQFAVAAMEMTGSDTSIKVCSGTLVGPSLVLTADHCVGPDALDTFFAFNYEYSTTHGRLLPMTHSQVTSVLAEDDLLDYAVVRVTGSPGLTYGWANVNFGVPVAANDLTIIQHPDGEPMQIGAGHLQSVGGGRLLNYADIDTDTGSSGAGILNSAGQLIGIHTIGGCTQSGGANGGLALAATSNVQAMRALANIPPAMADGDRIRIVYLGAGNVRSLLAADPATGQVVLAPEGNCGTSMLAEWVAKDLGDGAFGLVLSNQFGLASGLSLAGVATGEVTLSEEPVPHLRDSDDFDNRWQALSLADGRVALRTVGGSDAARWLGRTAVPSGEGPAKLAAQASFWLVEHL